MSLSTPKQSLNESTRTLTEPDGTGTICYLAGPVIKAKGLHGCTMQEMVLVGHEELLAEAVKLGSEGKTKNDGITIQVYEQTEGLGLGEPVKRSGRQISAELGPGLLGKVFDGIQRPLSELKSIHISRGYKEPALNRTVTWHFHPHEGLNIGDDMHEGDIVGHVVEGGVAHQIMVPPGTPSGKLLMIAEPGHYTVETAVAQIGGIKESSAPIDVTLMHEWPVRKQRPTRERKAVDTPIVTGQRCIDTLFPLFRGGTAAIAGGFGAGKTSLIKAIAENSALDIVVFIGCGERGNEIAELLEKYRRLDLMKRTIIIANTSNMPVAARETSIYTGVAMAEYYRDMGLQVLVVADSTSRWAEALREISGRLDEPPGEGCFPNYMNSRIAEIYERAGNAVCLGAPTRRGSMTLIGTVSPPAGQLSDQVAQVTQRFVQAFWRLDKRLLEEDPGAFPAIKIRESWNQSIELAARFYDDYRRQNRLDFEKMRDKCNSMLLKYDELHLAAKMNLPMAGEERATYETAKMLKVYFTQQDGTYARERYCPFFKTAEMLHTMLDFHAVVEEAVRHTSELKHYAISWRTIQEELEDEVDELEGLRLQSHSNEEDFKGRCNRLRKTIKSKFHELVKKRKMMEKERRE